jgi:hypothetical protein
MLLFLIYALKSRTIVVSLHLFVLHIEGIHTKHYGDLVVDHESPKFLNNIFLGHEITKQKQPNDAACNRQFPSPLVASGHNF